VLAVFFLAIGLISMLRLWIPGAQVWKSIRVGVYIQRTPLDEADDFSESTTATGEKPYRKVQ